MIYTNSSFKAGYSMSWRKINFDILENSKHGKVKVEIDVPGAIGFYIVTDRICADLAKGSWLRSRYLRILNPRNWSLWNASRRCECGYHDWSNRTLVQGQKPALVWKSGSHLWRSIGIRNFLRTPREHISLTQYASLIGSGYVVARGLNNIKDAKSKAIFTSAAHKELV
jgi:hypothetical protein